MDRLNKKGVKVPLINGLPQFILFSGKFGSGKDTFGTIRLKDFLEGRLCQLKYLKFADSLKHCCAALLMMPIADMYSTAGKGVYIEELSRTVGTIQQDVGVALRKEIHADIFLMPVHRERALDLQGGRISIVTDCRFPNEAIRSQEIGGIIIRLNRREDLIDERFVAGRDRQHISETALDNYPDFDLVVDNNGTIEEAWVQIERFLLGL